MRVYREDYTLPKKSGDYFKPENKGKYRIRILGPALTGWEDWMENPDGTRKPVRYAEDKKPSKSFIVGKDVKHFHALVIWNYQDKRVQVWSITQSTVQRALKAIEDDADWGPMTAYDLELIKRGKGIETVYLVEPLAKTSLDPEIKKAFAEKPCNLEELLTGGKPFGAHSVVESDSSESDPFADMQDNLTSHIRAIFLACSDPLRNEIKAFTKKHFGVDEPDLVPKDQHERLLNWMEKKLAKEKEAA